MKLFFSVGEPSGDLHGANLIRELTRRAPGIACVGYGGPKMAAAGFELHADLTQLAVMWLGRALWNIRTFFALRDRAAAYFRAQRPDAVVLIDYPGFNWHIAKAAQAEGIPVFYYGVPQLWAWAPWRVKKMQRWVNYALCKLPFEETWFRARGVNATYVGHPYYDQLATQQLDAPWIANLHASLAGRPLVAILPGSRTQEVKLNLPPFLRAVKLAQERVPQAAFAIAAYNEKQAALARKLVAQSGLTLDVHVNRTQELMEAARCCLACSGSVSLELLWRAKPAAILYQVSRLGYFLQSYFRQVKYITLVNLLADNDIFHYQAVTFDPQAPDADRVPMPEYLTCGDRARDLAEHVVEWVTDNRKHAARVQLLSELRARVAAPGASSRGAAFILAQLTGRQAAAA